MSLRVMTTESVHGAEAEEVRERRQWMEWKELTSERKI
jgi:hypothetical protein